MMKTLTDYIQILHKYMQEKGGELDISRMGVFGSVAIDENKEGSDVDVYVEGQLRGFFALAGIQQDLQGLLGCHVDIVRLRDKMDSVLRDEILREGVYYV